MTDDPKPAASWNSRSRYSLGWIVVALVCLGASIRIAVAMAAPAFSGNESISLLRSDPALLYYITERLVENGGWPPEDFRADPRIEYPETTDTPAMFTVGQEFLVSWAYLIFGLGMPLHLFALVFMALVASMSVVGVVGLTRELTGSRAWAFLAGLVYVVTAGSYRTIGFILLREDLSLPLFSLHLYLLARALRLRSSGAIAAGALAAVAALAPWHAMSFIFTIEVAFVFAWFLRTGENPMQGKPGWITFAILAAGGLLIPVLLSKSFLLSYSAQLLCVMAVMPILQRRFGHGHLRRLLISLLSLAIIAVICVGLKAWLTPNSGDYAHVVEMMLAKVRYLGALPLDPGKLSYGARLIWAGPFATSSPGILFSWLGALVFLMPAAAFVTFGSWWRGRGDGRVATLVAFGFAALVLALMVQRLSALVAILAPTIAVLLLRSSIPASLRGNWVAALLLVQAVLATSQIDSGMIKKWYDPIMLEQLADTLHYIQDELPNTGAIAADMVVSSAVLAQTGHPSVLQPKYETTRSRDRIERFTKGLFHESSKDFREILRSEFDASYLLIDAQRLWSNRYAAGIPFSKGPQPGSAASRLLNSDRNIYGTIPGYRLLYQSHPQAPRYRLYDLVDRDRVSPAE